MNRRAALAVIVLVLLAGIIVGVLASGGKRRALSASDFHVVAGGALMFERPSDFGLAVHPAQLLVRSYIPACDESFDYCLYYLGEKYEGTNFESAGIRIERRADLEAEHGDERCLATPPRGYLEFPAVVHRDGDVAVSRFAPVGDAAVGHYAEGQVFRLAYHSMCYEFEMRIGSSRFENWADGTIREFTQAMRDSLEARLLEVLGAIRLVDRPEFDVFQFPEF